MGSPFIAVSGFGMRTPVGSDAVQSASAVRAGCSRFSRGRHLGVSFDDDEAVVGSSMPPELGDLPWTEKAIDLAPEPVYEALWSAKLYDLSELRRSKPSSQVGAYIATPYRDRAGVSEEAFRLFAAEAKEHCIAPARADRVELVSLDHSAGLAAVARASADLLAGKIDVGVVGGFDSLLHSEYLRWLHSEGRLKLPGRADGLIPGEAAAVLVLERSIDATARGATPVARIASVALDRESVPLGPEHPIRAEGLSRAVRAAIEGAGGGSSLHRVLMDATGERWRFLEWSLLETRCLGGLPRGWQLWHPADCLGDIGAVFGTALICLAVRAFRRGYGGPGGALIATASDRGERAAACVFPCLEGKVLHAGDRAGE